MLELITKRRKGKYATLKMAGSVNSDNYLGFPPGCLAVIRVGVADEDLFDHPEYGPDEVIVRIIVDVSGHADRIASVGWEQIRETRPFPVRPKLSNPVLPRIPFTPVFGSEPRVRVLEED